MKYNQKVSQDLEFLKNEKCRKSNIQENEDEYLFDNQINAGKEIVKSFTAHKHPKNEDDARNNHVLLCAKMQSGKTGVCNSVINIFQTLEYLKEYFKIEKFYFITGMNGTGLHEQTVDRILKQVLDINKSDVIDAEKPIKGNNRGLIYIQKNSGLRKNDIVLEKCLVFIDESHYGSNKNNVLTTFLSKNGIDWKNRNEFLKQKNIYIVSVSATPFAECASDVADCKTIVKLETDEKYFGVSEFLENEQIFNANTKDFKENLETKTIPIIEYIKEAHSRIILNNNKGYILIRTRNKSISENQYIKNNFRIKELNTAKGGSIDYSNVDDLIKLMIHAPDEKPLIFFIKGAYRAGITINEKHKDYCFMIYDNSNESTATPQGLLGRMCGYRSNKIDITNTKFYVNLQHAEDYAEYEQEGFSKTKIPSSRTWEYISDDAKIEKEDEVKIKAKSINNHAIPLSDSEIMRFINASKVPGVVEFEFCENEVRILYPHIKFDYIGACFIRGKQRYALSVHKKFFDSFNDTYISGFYPATMSAGSFKKITGRKELDIEKDLGKTFIHVVLDTSYNDETDEISGNKRLLISHGILTRQKRIKSVEKLIQEHKNTDLLVY